MGLLQSLPKNVKQIRTEKKQTTARVKECIVAFKAALKTIHFPFSTQNPTSIWSGVELVFYQFYFLSFFSSIRSSPLLNVITVTVPICIHCSSHCFLNLFPLQCHELKMKKKKWYSIQWPHWMVVELKEFINQ